MEEPKVEAGQRKGNVARTSRLDCKMLKSHSRIITKRSCPSSFLRLFSSFQVMEVMKLYMTTGLVAAKRQSSFARPVWPKTEFQHRKALRRCRHLGFTSFQEVDLFKTDATKRCGKFQTKMDIQASRKLQPSAQWKPKLSPGWPTAMALGCA